MRMKQTAQLYLFRMIHEFGQIQDGLDNFRVVGCFERLVERVRQVVLHLFRQFRPDGHERSVEQIPKYTVYFYCFSND